MTFTSFLIKAKSSTYASGNESLKLPDKSEEYTYAASGYLYRDRYFASDPNPFVGQEIVFKDDKPFWSMNYYGYTLDSSIEGIYKFLRKALALVEEARPFRGPNQFKEGDFEYLDSSQGTIDNFKGTEQIFFKGKLVYELQYHGGKL